MPGAERRPIGQEYRVAFFAGLPGAAGGNGERRGSDLNWQSIARTYQLGITASIFGIPERSWNHPTVHSFVEAAQDTQDLQYAFSNAQRPYIDGVEPSLGSRYNRLDVLTGGLNELLRGGLDGSFQLAYMINRIEEAVSGYGVKIADLSASEEKPPRDEFTTPLPQPRSAWRDFGQPAEAQTGGNQYDLYLARYGSHNYKLWAIYNPRQNPLREDEVRLTQSALKLGIPEQNLELPNVREFVANLTHTQGLLDTFEQGEVPPGAPGLTPSVAERFAMSAHLMQVAIAIMEEGFQERTVDPQFIAEHVNGALSYFGFQARLQLPGDKLRSVNAEQ